MSRPQQAACLLKRGRLLHEIALEMEITTASALGYLCQEVGRGSIGYSDILLGVDPSLLNDLDSHSRSVDKSLLQWYDGVKTSGSLCAELLFRINRIQREVQAYIAKVLGSLTEDNRMNWWYDVVPVHILMHCLTRREMAHARTRASASKTLSDF